jgi:hypothetical protein
VVERAVLIGVAAAVMVVLVVTGTPMPCRGQTSKAPFRGCKNYVYGLFGRCRHHGMQPGRRVIAVLGGHRLLLRRVCAGCGLPTEFCRAGSNGWPFLGCSGFPSCTKRRSLAYRRW